MVAAYVDGVVNDEDTSSTTNKIGGRGRLEERKRRANRQADRRTDRGRKRERKRVSVRISLTVRKVACRALALGRQARCNEEVKSWRVHGSMVA